MIGIIYRPQGHDLKSFNDFMSAKHYEENPEVLDDDLPDSYDAWVAELTSEDVLAFANEYTSRNAQVFADDYCKEQGIDPYGVVADEINKEHGNENLI